MFSQSNQQKIQNFSDKFIHKIQKQYKIVEAAYSEGRIEMNARIGGIGETKRCQLGEIGNLRMNRTVGEDTLLCVLRTPCLVLPRAIYSPWAFNIYSPYLWPDCWCSIDPNISVYRNFLYSNCDLFFIYIF